MERCQWVGNNELMQHYHDHEWGFPVHNDQLLFEFLTLEGAQAGLSWKTILKKREYYKTAFDNFETEKVAAYSSTKIENLLSNHNLIRSRRKIESVISNAQAIIEIQKQHGSFSNYIWSFTQGKTIQNSWQSHLEIPKHTIESRNMSNELKKKGFKFVGQTICYSFMQAVGMVNDHTINCFRHRQIKKFNFGNYQENCMIINVKTKHRTDMVDITDKIDSAVKQSTIITGLVHIYSMHTTAAITINENADPDVKKDIANTLDHLIPWENNYQHTEGNSAAHLKTSLIGTSELIPIENGKLILGTWQGVFLCEFDGPRQRTVQLTFIKS